MKMRRRYLVPNYIERAFLSLLDSRAWRRHPAPFAKTRRGAQRRTERAFVRSFDII